MLELLTLLCLGDSITLGGNFILPSEQFCEVAVVESSRLEATFNYGCAGATAGLWLPGLAYDPLSPACPYPAPLWPALDPDDINASAIVHIFLGHNSAGPGISQHEWLGQMLRLIDAFPNALVLVSPPLLWPGIDWQRAFALISYRNQIADLIESRPNVCFGVDPWVLLAVNPAVLWNGSHPLALGHSLIGEALAERIADLRARPHSPLWKEICATP